ncbi:hypothetical protein GQ44DRAFT_830317 [Phaeosphaeriaceae sp. PMI808]|nr:hypothetical protein GQ44DRAFT_830317 [Phaeosphaeriaceae sp. PMI808]
MHDMAFKLTAFPRPTLRSGCVVSAAATATAPRARAPLALALARQALALARARRALARARRAFTLANAAELAALYDGVGGDPLFELYLATERAEKAVERAEEVVKEAARRP